MFREEVYIIARLAFLSEDVEITFFPTPRSFVATVITALQFTHLVIGILLSRFIVSQIQPRIFYLIYVQYICQSDKICN